MLFSNYDHQARRNDRAMRQCQRAYENAQPPEDAFGEAMENTIGEIIEDYDTSIDLIRDQLGEFLEALYYDSGAKLADAVARLKVIQDDALMDAAEKALAERCAP